MGDESPNLRQEPEPSSEAPKKGETTPTPMPGELPVVVGESHIFHEAPFFAQQSLVPPESAEPQPASEPAVATLPPAPLPAPPPTDEDAAFALTTISTSPLITPEGNPAPAAPQAAAEVAPQAAAAETAAPAIAAAETSAPVSQSPATEPAPQTAAEPASEETPVWTGFQIDTEGGSSDEEATDEEVEEGEPAELPAPFERTGSIPIVAGELSLAMALFVGGAMVACQRMLYLPLLYSIALGMLLGWALSRAPHRGCTNRVMLWSLTLAAVLLAQATFHVGNFLWDNHRASVRNVDVRALSHLATKDDAQRFWRYFQDEARRKTVFGFPLGPYGYYVLASCETVLMFMFAWLPVRSARRLKLAGAVPVEVLERVIDLRRRKLNQDEVFLKLSEQGWISPRDQHQAWDAADAYLALIARRRRR